MDYEKKYREAIRKAKKWYDANTNKDYREIFEEIFPELIESEDEKIRKRIIQALHGDVLEMSEIKEAVAWLEKQGKQNPQGKTALEAIKEEKVDNQNCVKPAEWNEDKVWTDNDYLKLKSIEYLLHELDNHNFDDWLDSLKNRVQPQPKQEWSDEDERAIGIIKTALEHPYDMEGKWDRMFALDWLKSLRPRSQWKPSNEQMDNK